MRRSFRARLVLTVIVLVALTTSVVAAVSFVLVRRSLRNQLVTDGVAQAEFNIGILASDEVLAPGSSRAAFEASGLPDRFLLRGTTDVYVDFGDGDAFASSLAAVDTPELVSPELADLVREGQLGFEFVTAGEEPALVVAGRRPPAGPDFYFYFSAAEVEAALGRLRGVLISVGTAVLAAGALVAGGIARQVLRPVRSASAAAATMASGDLSARLPETSRDEFGHWARSFNVMAESLMQKVTALQQAEARERRFVADVSHELRTPLTALVNEAALLQDHLATLPATPQRLAELLVADVSRLRTLTEDLLEMSRLDAAPDAVDATVVDLAALLGAIGAERHPDAVVDVEIPGGAVVVNRHGLERIIANLLDNARAHAPGAPVRIEARRAGTEVRIQVADGGPGVDPEDLPHIFERFYKADRARQGGTGLGLSIARQHARRLGGHLTARPGDRGGLVFDLILPVTISLPDGDGVATGADDTAGDSSGDPGKDLRP